MRLGGLNVLPKIKQRAEAEAGFGARLVKYQNP